MKDIKTVYIKEKLPKIEINLVSRRKYMTNIAKQFIEEELLINETLNGG